jgi:hypothetical protein
LAALRSAIAPSAVVNVARTARPLRSRTTGLVFSSPPVKVVGSRVLPASQREPDEPDDKENGGDDPQGVHGEPERKEKKDKQ